MKRLINKTILLSMAVMLAACNQKKEETAANPQAAKDAKPEVKIEQVFAQNVAQTETYAGTVESNIKNSISPNAPYRKPVSAKATFKLRTRNWPSRMQGSRWRTSRWNSTALPNFITLVA